MLTRNQLINHWKRWMNRNRSFSKPEMEELESHLWVEMDELIATDGCSEEEAFAESVIKIGSENKLSQDFIKTKSSYEKAIIAIKNNHLFIIASLLLVIIFLISDMLFSQTHYKDVYISLSKKEYIKMNETKTEFSEYNPEKPFLFSGSCLIDGLKGFTSEKFYWFHTNSFNRETFPVYAGKSYLPDLIFVLDNKKQLWISDNSNFDYDSLRSSLIPSKKNKIKDFEEQMPKISNSFPIGSVNIGSVNISSFDTKISLSALQTQIKNNGHISGHITLLGKNGEKYTLYFPNEEGKKEMEAKEEMLNLKEVNKQEVIRLSKTDINSSTFILTIQFFRNDLPYKIDRFRTELLHVKYGWNNAILDDYVLAIEYVDKTQKPQHIIPYLVEKLNFLVPNALLKR